MDLKYWGCQKMTERQSGGKNTEGKKEAQHLMSSFNEYDKRQSSHITMSVGIGLFYFKDEKIEV